MTAVLISLSQCSLQLRQKRQMMFKVVACMAAQFVCTLHRVAKGAMYPHKPVVKGLLLSIKTKLRITCAYSLPALLTAVVPIEPPRSLDRLIYRLPRLPGHAPDIGTAQDLIISIVLGVTWHVCIEKSTGIITEEQNEALRTSGGRSSSC